MKMSPQLLYRKVITHFKLWVRWGLTKRGFWTRAFLCWLFACLILQFDEIDNYDTRFKLRGDQKADDQIVLINMNPNDFVSMFDLKTNTLINVNESNEISDSFYWDQRLWTEMLSQVLKQNPKSVAVTLYFGENIISPRLNSQEIVTLKDPRIIWATNSREIEKLSLPFATLPDRSNIAHIDLLRDDDGVVRRLLLNPDSLPNLAYRVSKETRSDFKNPPVLNYRGKKQFHEVSLSDVLSKKIPADVFKNKIVVIGAEQSVTSQVLTPLGTLARHEFWATVIDNFQNQRFIEKWPISVYITGLLFLMILCVYIITHYTQMISFFCFFWIGTFWSVFSVWMFDTHNTWIPIVSPITMMLLIWVMYLGYQTLRIEQAHNQLQQEQRYLNELEQLKNNFVSLISHDLKTPIAKIQAVVDRVRLDQHLPGHVQEDLNNLKEYSEELNRYIQSILKVLRVESKDFKINKETADLNGIIENVLHRISPLAQSKGLEIRTQLEPMFLIEFDVTLMTEVILNLVENAIKYSKADGYIEITTSETDTDILVTVSDNGEGISPEDQSTIWKKFVRGKNQDLKTKGSGLGLYLVKYFIELHGGQISLKSEVGKGSTFYITLPIESES